LYQESIYVNRRQWPFSWRKCHYAGDNFGEDALNRKHAVEITRYGGAELHNIAAVIRGIAVKDITHQYTPLNNTYIYNGVACAGSSNSL
jgi:hypothetical protein